jgi:hypothetical protein
VIDEKFDATRRPYPILSEEDLLNSCCVEQARADCRRCACDIRRTFGDHSTLRPQCGELIECSIPDMQLIIGRKEAPDHRQSQQSDTTKADRSVLRCCA